MLIPPKAAPTMKETDHIDLADDGSDVSEAGTYVIDTDEDTNVSIMSIMSSKAQFYSAEYPQIKVINQF